MKKRIILILFLILTILSLIVILGVGEVFYDDFSDNSINTTLWNYTGYASYGSFSVPIEGNLKLNNSVSCTNVETTPPGTYDLNTWVKVSSNNLSSYNTITFNYSLYAESSSGAGGLAKSNISVFGNTLINIYQSQNGSATSLGQIQLTKNGTQYDWSLNGTYKGTIDVIIGNLSLYSHCTETQFGYVETANSKIYNFTYIEITAPTINLIYPTSNSNLTYSTITFSGNITTTGTLANVSLILDGVYNTTNSSGITGIVNFTKTLNQGSHNWTYESCDDSGCANATTTNFTIDSLAPTIHSLSPLNTSYLNSSSQILKMNITDTNSPQNITFYLWNTTALNQTYTITNPDMLFSNFSFSIPTYTISGMTSYNNLIYIVLSGTEYVQKYWTNGTKNDGTYYLDLFEGTGMVYLQRITHCGNFFFVSNYSGGNNVIMKFYDNFTSVTNTTISLASSGFQTITELGCYNNNSLLVLKNSNERKLGEFDLSGSFVQNITLANVPGQSYDVYGFTIGDISSNPIVFAILHNYNLYPAEYSQLATYYINGTYRGGLYDMNDTTNMYHVINTSNSFFTSNGGGSILYKYNYTTNLDEGTFNNSISLNDGNYTWNAYGCDSLGNCGFSNDGNYTFIIDTTTPQIDFTTGTENDLANVVQNFIYASVSINESNPKNITYTLYNSTGSQINSTTYTSLTTTINWTGLTQGYSYKYNVTIFDWVNKSNITSTRTITLASPGTGGSPGGGGTGGTDYSQATNFTISTLNGQKTLDLILAKDSTKPRIGRFLLINSGIEPITLKLSCSTSDTNESSKSVKICNYVNFTQEEYVIPANSLAGVIGEFKLKVPEDSEIGDDYYFNILATSTEKSEYDKLSVKGRVTLLADLYKWNHLPFQSNVPDSEKKSYPIFLVALFIAVVLSILNLFVFVKLIKLVYVGLFVSFIIFVGSFIGTILLL